MKSVTVLRSRQTSGATGLKWTGLMSDAYSRHGVKTNLGEALGRIGENQWGRSCHENTAGLKSTTPPTPEEEGWRGAMSGHQHTIHEAGRTAADGIVFRTICHACSR